jgi:multidrug efflux pump subunit AcrA (membrane-fusion protein)
MKKMIPVLLLALTVLLSACGGAAEQTPTPEVDLDYAPVVSVTGEVAPTTWAMVSPQTGGTVVEVLVEPGIEVAAGDILFRLDDTDARLAVQQAEAALQNAQAQLALLQADPLAEEVAMAEANLDQAEAALSQAAAQRDQIRSGATEAEIAAAEAQVAAAEAEWLVAREAHDQTMRCYDVTRPDGTTEEVCPALGTLEEQARYAMHAAEQAFTAAQAQLDALIAGAGTQTRAADAGVWAASAQRDAAQAQFDLILADPIPAQIAVAEAAISQAEAGLASAQVALERCEIAAPFASTVGAVDVRLGELVSPGQPAITLGDLTTLRVETTDLDEIDVARVAIVQPATITFDAMPDRVFDGHVTRISPMATPGAGGVNYTVVIELDELDPAIRWGMTAFVDIEAEE